MRMLIKDKPKYKNLCEHSKDEFVGSILSLVGETLQDIDVYVFQHEGYPTQDVCIRFGNKPEAYFSAGELFDFIMRGSDNTSLKCYQDAVYVISQMGTIGFTKKSSK